MIRGILAPLRRFRRDEDGGVILVEFCIMVPIIFFSFFMAIEMAVYSMREMSLDRAVNIAARYTRLNTNANLTHDRVKGVLCDNALFLDDCENTLRLEMKPVKARSFAAFDRAPDCVDTSLPAQDPRDFRHGREHALVIMRACVKFKPFFPTTGLGREFAKDGTGSVRLVAVTAFVQEPN